jgi:hypothetical protein
MHTSMEDGTLTRMNSSFLTKRRVVVAGVALTLLLGAGISGHIYSVNVAQQSARQAAQTRLVAERAVTAAAGRGATAAADQADTHLAQVSSKLDANTLASYTAAIATVRDAVTAADVKRITLASTALTTATATADTAATAYDAAQAAAAAKAAADAQAAADAKAAADAQAAAAAQAASAAQAAAAAKTTAAKTTAAKSTATKTATKATAATGQTSTGTTTSSAGSATTTTTTTTGSTDTYTTCGIQSDGSYIRCTEPAPAPIVTAPPANPDAGQCVNYGIFTQCNHN